ncbi:rhamnulokinase [Salirhabdus salicampi]|uniref:rhamnulokinase n=1 Tax=Salirhabdus salicampi TaxID=476102 RepID=UPI0020C4AA3A|nr:rhamnulokinase family protein [Salirhabdus salicampi]MCP8617574.1 rhamnulokinase [Salirhabdus salicampi]
MKKVWAFDLGASSGRLMLASFDGQQIHTEEVHRFSNHPVFITNHYHWDLLNIFQEMKRGISKSVKMGHNDIESMAIDTWGVDFGLISSSGELLGNPYSYRDNQTFSGMEKVLKKVTKKEWFQRSGIEPAPINTICQLVAIQERQPHLLEHTETLLLTPNLVSYLFSGEKFNEYTISTTTSMYNIEQKNWDTELMNMLNIPSDMMAPVVKPGTIVGPTMSAINDELHIHPVKVIAGAGHDTACAFARIPANDQNAVFMSCGTWILLGIKVDKPVVTEEAFQSGFTNEGTMDGKYRLMKNSMGLWLIQRCKAVWDKEGTSISYEEENRLVNEAKPFQRFINPDDTQFLNPLSMTEQIAKFCRETGQSPPITKGDFLRCILESLALKYRWVIENLESMTDKSIQTIYMGGGGIQNQVLCQFIANATQRKVVAGPVEATSIGNAVGQFMALGEIKDYEQANEVINRSITTNVYEPNDQASWQDAYQQFVKRL